mmetsp:Transcript_79599/g.225106  ORF Transcript_79599/g.225106 Transcript_79599/m.225106 type:complete len:140 (-) Transcript_79599:54-473(-)
MEDGLRSVIESDVCCLPHLLPGVRVEAGNRHRDSQKYLMASGILLLQVFLVYFLSDSPVSQSTNQNVSLKRKTSKQAIDVEKLRNALKTSVIKEGDLDKPETEHRWTALDCVALNSLGCSGDKASNCKAAARPGGRATE